MTQVRREFKKGIKLKPDTTALSGEGEVKYDDTAKKVQYQDDSATRSVVSEDGTQTLTNKTIVASDNTITTAASGNLTSTELDAALAELQTDIDTRALDSDLTSHTGASSGVHGVTGDVVGTTDIQTLESKTLVVSNNTITTAASGNLTSTELNAALAELQTDIDTRATDADLTSHTGASSGVHGVTGDVVGTTDTQTLTDKTVVVSSNTITTAASGNLTSTELNAALAELQTDIDTRATDADLTSHTGASSGVHGVTGDVVGTTDTQTLTNKTINTSKVGGGTASATNKLLSSSDTKSNLDSLAREAGSMYYATDVKQYFGDNGTSLISLGGGAGSADTVFIIDGDDEADTSNWSDGDGTISSGSALPGGTLQGTFAIESASPLEGAQSYKYTQAAGSLDSYFLSPVQNIDPIFRGKDCGYNVPTKYNGSDGDLNLIIWDETNDRKLVEEPIVASTDTTNNQGVFTIPSTCTQLRIGFQVASLDSGKVLEFDLLSVYDRPFVYDNAVERQTITYSAITWLDGTAEVRFDTANLNDSGEGILSIVDNAGSTRTEFTANRPCTVEVGWSAIITTGNRQTDIFKNSTVVQSGSRAFTATANSTCSSTIKLDAGDYISVGSNDSINTGGNAYLNITAYADVETIESSASKVEYTHTIAYNGYTSKDGSNHIKFATKVQDTDNNILTTDNTGSRTTITALKPCAVTVAGGSQAAGGGQNFVVEAYNSSNTLLFRTGDTAGSATLLQSAAMTYTLAEGDYLIASTLSANSPSNNDYCALSVTAFSNPFPKVIKLVDRVAYLKDIKSSGSNGGSFPNGSYLTRTLNTLEGESSFVSLSSNQFTLLPGTYDIEAEALCYIVGRHQVRLRNITDSTTDIIGMSTHSSSGSQGSEKGELKGRIILTDSKTFELQHRGEITNAATTGQGIGVGFGENENFAIVKIKKVK